MELFDDLRGLAERAAQRVAQYSTLAKDGAARGYDAIVHRGVQLKARRLQPYGLRSVALKGAEVVVLGINAGRSNKVYIAAEVRDHGPADLQPGEVALYNKVSGTLVKLDKDGNVRVDAGAGKEVVVNGGTLKVARDTDPCKIGAPLAAWMVQVETAINALAPGAVAPLSPTFVANPGITVNGGAARFKG